MSSTLGLLDNADLQSRSTSIWKERVVPALLAAVLGLALVYSMGFAELSALHNAAHDSRHAAGFPCH